MTSRRATPDRLWYRLDHLEADVADDALAVVGELATGRALRLPLADLPAEDRWVRALSPGVRVPWRIEAHVVGDRWAEVSETRAVVERVLQVTAAARDAAPRRHPLRELGSTTERDADAVGFLVDVRRP
ncbi:hypothetical protein [Isoptericola sp. NPDC057559]|uniref:hypothetical protein n=1 Tax=Isoptericola sp. NPDC057559 TaxID=3346168 RepID=UPI0036AF85A5